MPHYLSYLLRYGVLMDVPEAVKMMEKTLNSIYKGGIYDHLGSGFSRYSVDEKWLVPHFEKMCYDNALLTIAYCEAFRQTNNPLYEKIVKDTLRFVERELLSPEGGFYTAIDADSDGIEGKYYVWNHDELMEVLSPDEYKLFVEYYNLHEKPFEHGYILNRLQVKDDELAVEPEAIISIKNKLIAVRNKRQFPHRDEKIITSNNGMMIAAFVNAYITFDDEHYLRVGENAAQFILTSLLDENGKLYTSYKDGDVKYQAYADDYAYMIWALIDLFLATGKLKYLDQAIAFTNVMMDKFYDEKMVDFSYCGR